MQAVAPADPTCMGVGMARPSLFTHRKLRTLTRLIGCKARAIGSLELIWNAGYQDGDPRLGSSDDVESAAEWRGAKGKLTSSLCAAGFVDDLGDGTYQIHELLDHAPDYVRKRRSREAERRSVSQQRPVTDRSVSSTPAPAPAPAPKNSQKELLSNSPPANADVIPLRRVRIRKPNGHTPERLAELTRLFELFYDDYPRHEGKQAAAKAFIKLNPSRDDLLAIARDLRRRVTSGGWEPEDPEKIKFIPLPATYVNGRRWEDQADARSQ